MSALNRYQPKGSMCMNCAKAKADCSGLKFSGMPVIDKHQDGTLAVRCTFFMRTDDGFKPPSEFRDGSQYGGRWEVKYQDGDVVIRNMWKDRNIHFYAADLIADHGYVVGLKKLQASSGT